MKEFFTTFIDIISGFFPFALLMTCGIYITYKTNFLQFTKFYDSIKLTLKAFYSKSNNKNGISSFQAAATALSATVGTGNIAGVAGAVSIGGSGAIFWMWISALLGMVIKYAEITLAIKTREEKNGKYLGGPMYYIKKLRPKHLSYIYALAVVFSTFTTGNITQSNVAIYSVSEKLSVRLILGLAFSVLTALVLLGGAKRIGKVTEKIIPIMSLLFTLLALGVIVVNLKFLPSAFLMIIKGAFNTKAVTGGAVGSILTTVITGASRGIFSNEAGLGTSAIAHSQAYDAKAETQGLFGIFEVFIDTILICTLTGLTILLSRVNIDYGNFASTELVATALSVFYGKAAKILLSFMMCIFAFSSVIGWALYGDICSSFLLGEKARKLFLIFYPLGCIVGAVTNTAFAWKISEFFNGIMLLINLPTLLLLSNDFIIKRKKTNDKRKIRTN